MKRIIASLAFALLLIPLVSASAQTRRDQIGRRTVRPARAGVPSRWNGRPGDRNVVVSHAQEMIEGEVVPESTYIEPDPIIEDGHVEGDYYDAPPVEIGCDSCGGGGCDSCNVSGGFCHGCNVPHRFCICFPSHGWVHAEYLLWYQSGMNVPPLVSNSTDGTARADAGVLGLNSTSVLFGANDYLTDERSGFRIRFGFWLSNFPGWGISGEYTGLGEETESFFQQSTGSPIIARPFFNALTGAEDAELVAFPSVVTGSISTDIRTRLDGAAFRFRKQLCCSTGCGFSEICCQTVPTSSRLDGTFGYRFWELTESIFIREQLQQTDANAQRNPGAFDVTDHFDTRNLFNGFELGFIWQGRRGWWSMDALMRLAIGNVNQTVTIAGSSAITENAVTTNFDTGFLAQRSNIGTYERDRFTMIPELGINVGYQMTKRWRATFGYSLIYWGNVVRPGDQIDRDLNPNLLAPEANPFTGPLRPQFTFRETDYWVQGVSFGGECRW